MEGSLQRPPVNSFFIEDVDKFMSTQESLEICLEQLNNEYRRFKFLEARLAEQKENLKQKLPEINRTLDAVKHLQKQTEIQKTTFELTNGVWVEAEVPTCETVFLWLGANVMVEYSFEEAMELLKNNLAHGKKTQEKVETDMAYMKDQITVTEVSILSLF
eukprot:TRINITY_DN5173_c0_g1_i16.p1 TRINITY_DN5173_c0_g1~~TRINITY_DN5173_c0_g1_i16.p1  ORF type:complete len:160 (-),score=37.54 TRINITY_DN5173_c0_g1_i16:176-655(-)